MIGYLRGTLITKDPALLIIDVHGVGYEVMVSLNTFCHLPEVNENLNLLIHMVIREDAQQLFGFTQEHERQLFRALIKVNGVGPKLALTILSGIESNQLIQCIHQKDVSRLTKIPGIGKKTAERLIVETKDILASWPVSSTESHLITHDQIIYHQPLEDAVSALTSLGYKPHEAKATVKLFTDQTQNTEELIRLSLQKLAKGIK